MANHIQNVSYVLMNDFGGSIESGAIEFEIAWSERFKQAYVKNYRVWANDVYVGCLNSSEDQKNTLIRELNTQHRSEEHTSELQSRGHLVCRLLLEKKKTKCNRTNKQQ